MGQKKYPVLDRSEVLGIMRALGFGLDRQHGSHAQYLKRRADGTHALVTVDMAEKEFDEYLITRMIRQSGHTRDEFYGCTKQTAKKAGLEYYYQRFAGLKRS
jgi:predicted RNA binding protein YcfA (HicA-like mRNA interferase family)